MANLMSLNKNCAEGCNERGPSWPRPTRRRQGRKIVFSLGERGEERGVLGRVFPEGGQDGDMTLWNLL